MMDNDKYDLVIRGGHIIDPALGFGANAHILIKEGARAGSCHEYSLSHLLVINTKSQAHIPTKRKPTDIGLFDIEVAS